MKWCKKVPEHTYQYRVIPTESSRPRHHPSELSDETVRRILVEADTIHDGYVGHQLYIYTLLDVHSRWAYAEPSARIAASLSATFVARAQAQAPFLFETVQTDHGSEFSKFFTKKLSEQTIVHRHSRVRTPNDNAHLERFNRTIQEECIFRLPRKLDVWEREIPEY